MINPQTILIQTLPGDEDDDDADDDKSGKNVLTNSTYLDHFISSINTGKATAKNAKKVCTIHHKSVSSLLKDPVFAQANGCQSIKKDRLL